MKHIMDDAINMYLDPTIPKWGPAEEKVDPIRWNRDIGQDPNLPGGGLARYDMLYIGEGHNTIYLIVGGKVIWTYETGTGNELDDIWMLTNGNILFSRMYWAAEITPHKEVVWRIEAPSGGEIHTLQPIGLDHVLVVVNIMPRAKLLIINKKTGETEVEKEIPFDGLDSVHGQHRRFRLTAQNTYLSSFFTKNKVVEYDRDFNEIWSYENPRPWAAIRLKNGNTLISDESDESVHEVTPDKKLVWKFCVSELPEDIRLEGTQSCVRLENGNTILCARGENGKTPQLVEVTPDKKVVWVVKDWKNLGPATAVQILRDGGVPEVPGDCQR